MDLKNFKILVAPDKQSYLTTQREEDESSFIAIEGTPEFIKTICEILLQNVLKTLGRLI